ncbi:hypothetical protein ACFLTU_05050 [Bacteroidota bacterium]
MKKQTIFWIIAVVVTLAQATYQRMTGPTYPVDRSIEISGQTIESSLPRSHGGETDKEIRIQIPDSEISGQIIYKRYKTDESYDTVFMDHQDTDLVGYLPHQPPAGKLEYTVVLVKDDMPYPLNDVPVVIRFKGSVPAWVLIPHILFIFTAELLSLVAGLFAIARLGKYKLYSILTVIFLFVGGFVLGPVIQKYAFGAYWTGFPFGQDLTDNKVLFAMIIWIVAVAMNIRKDRPKLALLAAIVLFLMNMIPHSMFGSELDYESGEVLTGMIMLF